MGPECGSTATQILGEGAGIFRQEFLERGNDRTRMSGVREHSDRMSGVREHSDGVREHSDNLKGFDLRATRVPVSTSLSRG